MQKLPEKLGKFVTQKFARRYDNDLLKLLLLVERALWNISVTINC